MKSEKEKMIAGEPYNAVDKELSEDRARAKKLLHRLNVTEYLFGKEASLSIKELLPKASPDLYIEPPFHCDYGYNIITGKRVYMNVNCVILDVTEVRLGNFVLFGPGVQIYTATHPLDAMQRRKHESARPVVIGDDCWIGGGAIILPGVTIGKGCVIGAGAVVTKDIPDFTMAAGNPARIIKQLTKYDGREI